MARMIAITVRAGATAWAVAGMAWPPNRAFTIPPPAAARTRKKVPSTSANKRRPSYRSSQKLNWWAIAFGRPSELSLSGSSRSSAGLLVNGSRPSCRRAT